MTLYPYAHTYTHKRKAILLAVHHWLVQTHTF